MIRKMLVVAVLCLGAGALAAPAHRAGGRKASAAKKAEEAPAVDPAAARDAAREVLDLSGTRRRLDQLPAQVEQREGERRGPLKAEEVKALRSALEAALDSGPLMQALTAQLSSAYDAKATGPALEWLRQPLWKKLRGLEEQARAPSAAQAVAAYGQELSAKPPQPTRLQLVKRINRAAGVYRGALDPFTYFVSGLGGPKTGTVKWFNDAKGFGYITPDDGGGDVYCHTSEIQRAGFKGLAEGERVQFEPAEGPQGVQAQHVTALGASAPTEDDPHARPTFSPKDSATLGLLYAFRSLSDAELVEYATFLESDGGKWYVRALADALRKALVPAGDRARQQLAAHGGK